MNKKGEILTLAVILVVLLGGLLIARGIMVSNERPPYIGDKSTKMFYNIKSNNPECNLQEIKIDSNSVVFFNTEVDALKGNYTKNSICY